MTQQIKVVEVDPNNFSIIEVVQQGLPGADGANGLPGIPGADGTANVDVTKFNGDTQNLVIGTPVYLSAGATDIKRANANDPITKDVLGLVVVSPHIAQNAWGYVRCAGIVVATPTEWLAVTGMVGGLVPNANYYLDTTLGRITPYPVTGDGNFLCRIGVALNSTDLLVRIEPPIWL